MTHPNYIGLMDLKTIATHLKNTGAKNVIDVDKLMAAGGSSYLAHKKLVISGQEVYSAWKVGDNLFLNIDKLYEIPDAVESQPIQSETLLGETCEMYRYHSGRPFFLWKGKILDSNELIGSAIGGELLSRLPKEDQ